MMSRLFREKKIYSGKMLEIEIFPITINEKNQPRKVKSKYSELKQRNLNDKNARKRMSRLISANFTKYDLALHLTYDDENLPTTNEEIKRDATNFLRKVKRYIKKNKLPKLKYIAVIEYRKPEGNEKGIRVHHHIILNGVIDRDTLEKLWGKGTANADRLQPDNYDYEALAKYITKDPKGSKRWTQSKNLKMPIVKANDSKYTSKRKIENLAKTPDVSEYFEKDQKGKYRFLHMEAKYYDELGWTIYVKMRKKDNAVRGGKDAEFFDI